MKIGVIGSGVVGQTLAAGFLKHGHEVEDRHARAGETQGMGGEERGNWVKSKFAEAAAFGEMIVALAVAGQATLEALKAGWALPALARQDRDRRLQPDRRRTARRRAF